MLKRAKEGGKNGGGSPLVILSARNFSDKSDYKFKVNYSKLDPEIPWQNEYAQLFKVGEFFTTGGGSFVGKIDEVKLKYNKGNIDKKIPSSWKVHLVSLDTDDDGNSIRFIIEQSINSSQILDLVNPMLLLSAGELAVTDFRISPYKLKGKSARISVKDDVLASNSNESEKGYLPQKFNWDEELERIDGSGKGGFRGIPAVEFYDVGGGQTTVNRTNNERFMFFEIYNWIEGITGECPTSEPDIETKSRVLNALKAATNKRSFYKAIAEANIEIRHKESVDNLVDTFNALDSEFKIEKRLDWGIMPKGFDDSKYLNQLLPGALDLKPINENKPSAESNNEEEDDLPF